MGVVTSYKPGTFCWIELSTTDGNGAKSFYCELFGWKANDKPVGPELVYTILQKNGSDVGALFQQTAEMKSQGLPVHWEHFISVENVDETTSKVAELGGTVLMESFDIMDAGRMAVIQDPVGATFSLWQPNNHFGAALVNEPGAVCWNELATRNVDTERDFYTSLFGWTTQEQSVEGGNYTTFMYGNRHVCGMLQMTEDWGDIPPHWMVYFAVDDCEARAAQIKELGGKIVHGPADIPGVGRFAVAVDPQGAQFTIIKLVNSD